MTIQFPLAALKYSTWSRICFYLTEGWLGLKLEISNFLLFIFYSITEIEKFPSCRECWSETGRCDVNRNQVVALCLFRTPLPPPLTDCLPAHSARTSTWLSSARTGTGGRVTHTETRWGWDSSRVIRERTWRTTRKKVGIFLWMTMNSQSVKLEFSVKSWHQDPAAASQLIF